MHTNKNVHKLITYVIIKMFTYTLNLLFPASLPKYNDEIHMKKHSEYITNFVMEEIPSTLLKKTVNIFRENDM